MKDSGNHTVNWYGRYCESPVTSERGDDGLSISVHDEEHDEAGIQLADAYGYPMQIVPAQVPWLIQALTEAQAKLREEAQQ